MRGFTAPAVLSGNLRAGYLDMAPQIEEDCVFLFITNKPYDIFYKKIFEISGML